MALAVAAAPPFLDRLPDVLVVDVVASLLSIHDAAQLFRTCRRGRTILAPAWRRLCRQRWLREPLHPREREALDNGTWDARALQVFLYRRRHAPRADVYYDLRLPRPWRLRRLPWIQQTPYLSDIQFDWVEHVVCDVGRYRCPSLSSPFLRAMNAIAHLPHVHLTHGRWSWVGRHVYRDGRWLAATLVRGRVWPTAVWENAAAVWMMSVVAQPADGLLRYSTQCPFCGRVPGTCEQKARCGFAWARWGSRWGTWSAWHLPPPTRRRLIIPGVVG